MARVWQVGEVKNLDEARRWIREGGKKMMLQQAGTAAFDSKIRQRISLAEVDFSDRRRPVFRGRTGGA